VGIQTPDIDIVLVMPQGTLKSLRHVMFLVPHADQGLEQRYLLAPERSRRRTQLSELRMRELPPERVFIVQLYGMPRTGWSG